MKFILIVFAVLISISSKAQMNASTKSVGESVQPMIYVPAMPSPGYDHQKYLQKNLRYPTLAREASISGRVIVQILVHEDGRISDCKVVRGIGGGCDEEALRVIKKMPRWKAFKNRRKKQAIPYVIPINFTLND